MTSLEYSPKDAGPASRSAAVRFLFRTNPFYLLSAMCMLGGCLALTNSLSWTSIPLPRLMALVVTLNVYEGLLLALGLFLLARRGIVRDGLMLLFLEALFLVDAAFLNVEVFAIDLRVGLVTNAAVFALAVLKLLLVFRAMRMRLDGTFGLVLLQLTVLFATPGVFAYATRGGDGALPPGLAYAAWWALGIVAVVAALLTRGARLNELLGEPAPGHEWVAAVVRRSFVWLPFVSLLAHAIMLHWVYDARLHAAYLTPVLMGAAVLLGGASPTPLLGAAKLALLRAGLPALGVALALDAPAGMRISPLGEGARVALTPLLVSLGLAYVVYVSLYLARHAVRLVALGVAAVLAYALGPTPAQVAAAGQHWAAVVIEAVAAAVYRVVPKTSTGWGVTAVGAAFAFLGLGAAVSLRKTPELRDEA